MERLNRENSLISKKSEQGVAFKVRKSEFPCRHDALLDVKKNGKTTVPKETIDVPHLGKELSKRKLRNENLRFARSVKRVQDKYVNADGTFQLDEIAQTDYFIAHPEQLALLRDRKLSEKSKKRQRASAREEILKKSEILTRVAREGEKHPSLDPLEEEARPEHSHEHHAHGSNHTHDHVHPHSPSDGSHAEHDHEHHHHHDNPEVKEAVEKGINGVLQEDLFVASIKRVRRGQRTSPSTPFEASHLDHIRKELAEVQERLGEEVILAPEEKEAVTQEFAAGYERLSDTLPLRYLRRRIKKVSHDYEHETGTCDHHGKKGVMARIKGMGPAIVCALDCYGPAIMHATGQFLDGLSGSGDSDHHHEDPAKILTPRTRIVMQLPRRKEEEELSLGRTTITFPADAVISKRDKMNVPPTVQEYFPNPLEEEAAVDPEQSLTWLDRQSVKLFGPLLREKTKEKKTQKKRTRVRSALVAATSVAVLGGSAVVSAIESQDPEKKTPGISQSLPSTEIPGKQTPSEKSPEKTPPKAITHTHVVNSGDSQWGIAEQIIQEAGYESSVPVTNLITNLIAAENKKKMPNPDTIIPGEITVPTEESITVVFDAMTQSEKHLSPAEKRFTRNLHTLNTLPSMSKVAVVETKRKVFAEITTFLTDELTQ